MSLAQQPGFRPATHAVTRLRWALAATGLALVMALGALALLLLSPRRAPLPPAVEKRGLNHPSARRALALRPPARGDLRGLRARSRPHAVATAARSRARVEIVERRVVPPPVSPAVSEARPPLAHPPAAHPQRVLGQRLTLTPQNSPPAKLPLIAIPPVDSETGDTAAQGSPPEPIASPAARYPKDAAAEGVTGSVRLKVIVGRRGRVEDTVVVRSSGDDRLDRAAADAVRRWRYRPALRDGRAVPAVDYEVIVFPRADRGPHFLD